MRESLADFKSKGGLQTMVNGRPDDLLLVSHSFEPRSLVISENLAESYAANLGIVYFNDDLIATKPQTEGDVGGDVLRYTLATHVNDVKHVKGSIIKLRYAAQRRSARSSQAKRFEKGAG